MLDIDAEVHSYTSDFVRDIVRIVRDYALQTILEKLPAPVTAKPKAKPRNALVKVRGLAGALVPVPESEPGQAAPAQLDENEAKAESEPNAKKLEEALPGVFVTPRAVELLAAVEQLPGLTGEITEKKNQGRKMYVLAASDGRVWRNRRRYKIMAKAKKLGVRLLAEET